MKTKSVKVSCSVPIRRSRWVNFFIGVVALTISALSAAALIGLPLLLNVNLGDGAVVVIIFSFLWFGFFFLSYPQQKRYARFLDLRRPGIRLRDGLLTIPINEDCTLQFKLDEPHQLTFGWFEIEVRNHRGGRTRWSNTFAILSQAGQQVLLKAEFSAREAQAAGWSNATSPASPINSVSLWASDLVALVEAMRAYMRLIAAEGSKPTK